VPTAGSNEDIDSSNIRVQINNLRKKLDKRLIVNIRGHGYKMLELQETKRD